MRLIPARVHPTSVHLDRHDAVPAMEVRKEKGCRGAKVRDDCDPGGGLADSIAREMQLFLAGFIVIEICEIFTVGGFPLHPAVRKVGGVYWLAISWFTV